MARRKSDSPQKAALREIMNNYLKEIDIPRDRKEEFEPQVIKKIKITVTQDVVFMDAIHYHVRSGGRCPLWNPLPRNQRFLWILPIILSVLLAF